LWKNTSQISVQRKCPDIQFLAAVGHIAVCTMQAADFLQIIGYVDTGFVVVVEVTACSFVVFLEWWVTDDNILQSI